MKRLRSRVIGEEEEGEQGKRPMSDEDFMSECKERGYEKVMALCADELNKQASTITLQPPPENRKRDTSSYKDAVFYLEQMEDFNVLVSKLSSTMIDERGLTRSD